MKRCSYCGRENDGQATHCLECGTGLPVPPPIEPVPEHPVPPPPPRLVDLAQLDGAFTLADGFSHPDWALILRLVRERITPPEREAAWEEIALQWVDRLRADLGGAYRARTSPRFILLSELNADTTGALIAFMENARTYLQDQLGEANRRRSWVKRVVLLFTEADDYYQYLSHFYRDGTHPLSAGCLIKHGYTHIAAPYYDLPTARSTLAHELTHACLAHRRLPLWLDEGCATTAEQRLAPGHRPILDPELRDRHLAFWQEERMQQFWAGTSFQEPGDASELSYSLAEIMVSLISRDAPAFIAFLRHARHVDAGQTAALDCLGMSLGDVAGSFLGPGDWRPYRHKLVACWHRARSKD